jgi:DNA replication licensing factor MCM2
VPVREWIAQDQTKAEIKRRFKAFLQNFMHGGSGMKVYEALIDAMCAANRQSLEVSYMDLTAAFPGLAIWLADFPAAMLAIFDETAKEVVLEQYEHYWMIHSEVHVRITNLPVLDSLRELRHSHLNALVKVSGVVVRRSGVSPQLKEVTFNCNKCGSVTPPVMYNGADEPRVSSCPECQSDGPFTVNTERTVYRNYQRVVLQESPGTVPAGRMPQSKAVILLADLIDAARPGEEVEVTGVYHHTFEPGANIKNGFPVFQTVIEANYIQRKSDAVVSREITAEDRAEIEKVKTSPNAVKRIVKSIAPSIYGNRHVKMAVALAMFGGREKNINQKHRIRGDINVLVLGDPGTAKSQVLKYVEKTAPRCVYTTGKGASAVGLTAAVHKDPMTGEWVLEGGALVLADRGVCCIDEFDKMTDQDRTSIHEAMEQQSISISKAGIVTTLQARCAVVAAANPIGGRYDPSKTFSENVQLTDPILTRFDVLCVLRDEVDPVADERLANFVVQSHARSHPDRAAEREAEAAERAAGGGGPGAAGGGAPVIAAPDDEDDVEEVPQNILRKYISYARELKPVVS